MQQKRFPNLNYIVFDLLSIPAISADPERVGTSFGTELAATAEKLILVKYS
jgi:hypothetical protein